MPLSQIGTLGNSKKRMATQSIPKAMLINSDEVDSKFSQQQLTIQPAPQSNILVRHTRACAGMLPSETYILLLFLPLPNLRHMSWSKAHW